MALFFSAFGLSFSLSASLTSEMNCRGNWNESIGLPSHDMHRGKHKKNKWKPIYDKRKQQGKKWYILFCCGYFERGNQYKHKWWLISLFTKPLHFKKKPNQISASFLKELNLPKSSSFFAGLVVSDFSYSSAFGCDAVNNMNEVSSSEFKAFKTLGLFMQPVNNNWLSNLTSQPVRNWIIISLTAVFLRSYDFRARNKLSKIIVVYLWLLLNKEWRLLLRN